MAWSVPLTAVASSALTAAQWNASVRDNLLQTAPAKATTAGRIFVSTGPNTIAERAVETDTADDNVTTTSTDWVNLSGGPVVTVTTGTHVMTWINAMMRNDTTAGGTFVSWDITGAHTAPSADNRGLYLQNDANHDVRMGVCNLSSVTAGSNTFRMQYRVQSHLGTYQYRRLQVMAM
jgi:hypothetical protein